MTASPLLSCLIWLTRYFGAPVAAENILDGLPAGASTLGLELLDRAALNASLDYYAKSLSEELLTDHCPLPCMAVYDGEPLLITRISGSIVSITRPYESERVKDVERSELLGHLGNTVFFSV